MARLAARRHAALLALPNLVMTDVPDAAPPAAPAAPPPWTKPFPPLPHWDLLEMLGLARPATATAGRGFLVWRGQGARLVRAMLGFMLDVHTRERGCEEVIAPTLATRAALTGSAHLPGLEGRMYAVGRPPPEGPSGDAPDADPAAAPHGPRAGDLFLAPRAEPHLAGLYAGLVLDGDHLPERLVAAAAALRQEIGSHGRAARGLLRLHEFPTVEVYTFCRPDQADAELAYAAASAETILDRLGLAHRRSLRSAPALSHAAARTVDLDVWAPGMGRWLPVAALSHFTDYQARRTGTRCSEPGGRARLAHTVGGAAVALPHALAALLETGQEADGSVRLPAALEPYAGMDRLGG